MGIEHSQRCTCIRECSMFFDAPPFVAWYAQIRPVINKKFQYQYSLLIAALAVLLVNGFIILRMLFPGEQPLNLSMPMTCTVTRPRTR